jgi:hypothetical protein
LSLVASLSLARSGQVPCANAAPGSRARGGSVDDDEITRGDEFCCCDVASPRQPLLVLLVGEGKERKCNAAVE